MPIGVRVPYVERSASGTKLIAPRAEEGIIAAIHPLEQQGIEGLGPAAANPLYFLHATVVPRFNTAIVKGYNALTGSRVRLGAVAGVPRDAVTHSGTIVGYVRAPSQDCA